MSNHFSLVNGLARSPLLAKHLFPPGKLVDDG